MKIFSAIISVTFPYFLVFVLADKNYTIRRMCKFTFLPFVLSLCLPLLFSQTSVGETRSVITITLHDQQPERSYGELRYSDGETFRFRVGFGEKGLLPEGSRFRDGYSLLGKFRINGILSDTRFELAPSLLKSAPLPLIDLKPALWRNMSSIDFDNDGREMEYGIGFLGLEPLSSSDQPFGFHEYKRVLRWYSFALHGTNDESRIGKKTTGGCINLTKEDLLKLLSHVNVGNEVLIKAFQ
jgi:hypothetical protein